MTKTYVYNGREVKLTNRTATKNIGNRSKIDTLYEIVPAGQYDASFKEWVRMTDLYEITDNKNKDKNPSE